MILEILYGGGRKRRREIDLRDHRRVHRCGKEGKVRRVVSRGCETGRGFFSSRCVLFSPVFGEIIIREDLFVKNKKIGW